MTYFASTMTGVALSAGFIFLLLRAFYSNSNQINTARKVSSHALWTSVIALFSSGVTGLSNLWAISESGLSSTSSFEARVMHAAAPGLWLGIIYLIGQFTWPRHLKPVRSASLEVRSAGKLIPRALAGILLTATLLSAVAIGFAWNDPGQSAHHGFIAGDGTIHETDRNQDSIDEYGDSFDDEEYDETIVDGVDTLGTFDIAGVLPGDQVAPYLAGGLLLVLISVSLVTATVVSRPPLPVMDLEETDILRRIWLNRLLRTAVLVSAGFGAMSLQYVAASISARSNWASIRNTDGFQGGSIDSTVNTLQMGSTMGMLGLAIAMLAWAPPRLPTAFRDTEVRWQEDPYSPNSHKARDFLTSMQAVAIIVLVVGVSLGATIVQSQQQSTHWQTTVVDGMEIQTLATGSSQGLAGDLRSALFTLAALAAAYLLLQLAAGHMIKRRLCLNATRGNAVRNLLPDWFLVLIAVSVATGVASIASFAYFALKSSPTLLPMAGIALLVIAGTAGMTYLIYSAAARRASLPDTDNFDDIQVRSIVAHRAARTLGGVSLIVAGFMAGNGAWAPARYANYMETSGGFEPNGFQILLYGLGLALFFLPASLAIPAAGRARPRSEAGTR